jgi:hypothetical protein
MQGEKSSGEGWVKEMNMAIDLISFCFPTGFFCSRMNISIGKNNHHSLMLVIYPSFFPFMLLEILENFIKRFWIERNYFIIPEAAWQILNSHSAKYQRDNIARFSSGSLLVNE